MFTWKHILRFIGKCLHNIKIKFLREYLGHDNMYE